MSDKEGDADASGDKRPHDDESDADASVAKRPHDEENNKSESEDEGWIGPLPTEAAPAKKRKGKIAVSRNSTNYSNACFYLIE